MISALAKVFSILILSLVLTAELYGLFRLVVVILRVRNIGIKLASFLGLLLLLPVLLFVDLLILYFDFALIFPISG